MAAIVYFLCALTGLAAFVLLLRSWLHTRARLLFWSALCFFGIALTNVLLVVDKLVVGAATDLRTPRLVVALVAVLLLVFGLIWEED
ncbi:hypothetical protein JI739_01340 [Ramlibacter sp. AW1]|uniref:Uncharacterized protein n=2 Tax=Ramlibacter aurantiacus TaxID=2801330 RepID=A0A936ZEU4_9BURK|nr:hypothetical protein [Ramlibacter aurantiacus]